MPRRSYKYHTLGRKASETAGLSSYLPRADFGIVAGPTPSTHIRRCSVATVAVDFTHKPSVRRFMGIASFRRHRYCGVCPILSRRAGGCSVYFGAFLLRPQIASTSRIVGGFHRGQCLVCLCPGPNRVDGADLRKQVKSPVSPRKEPAVCRREIARPLYQLSYRGICAAGRRKQRPRRYSEGGFGMDYPARLF